MCAVGCAGVGVACRVVAGVAGGAGGDGDAGTVKRGGMLEKNNVKVEYTFPESFEA